MKAQNLREVTTFLAFVSAGALCVYYYVTFKTYHSALTKLDSLNALLSNPNARVASGEQGTEIMRKVKAVQTQAVANQAAKTDSLDEKLAKIEELLAARKDYQPPKVTGAPQATYALQQPLLMSQAPAFQVSAPLMPEAPKPTLESLSKQDLVKLLLKELARNGDLEK